jgi:hypothetical protein
VQEALITQRALQAEYAVEPDEQLMVTFEETAETAFSSIDEIVAAYPDTPRSSTPQRVSSPSPRCS